MVELEQQIDQTSDAASADALSEIAGDLYDMAAVLTGQAHLRRLLADPAADPAARAGLIGGLFGGKVSDAALDLAQASVGLRWSTPWDMADALEIAGDRLLLGSAEKQGQLDEVEDQVFRFGRILAGNDELRSLLDEQIVPAERRSELLRTLLAEKADPITVQLLDHAVRTQRKRSIVLSIDDLLDEAAARRHRSTAFVRTALPISDEQIEHLARALTELYHRPIDVRTEVDPTIRGGVIIRIGDEIIDGSIAARLAAVRAALGA